MRFIVIHTIMQASKRASRRLRAGLHLSAPSAEERGPRRKDRTGFIFALLAITLAVAVFLLA
jgi:hypothetical protein